MATMIFKAVLAPIFASLLTGFFFMLLDGIKSLKKLIALLLALKNECRYNSIHRGNSQSKFQLYWFEQAFALLEFYEYCPALYEKCHEAFELAKDANCDQITSRKMVPSDVQVRMRTIADEIETAIPQLRTKTRFLNFLCTYFKRQSQ